MEHEVRAFGRDQVLKALVSQCKTFAEWKQATEVLERRGVV